jgi:hypothetical protein
MEYNIGGFSTVPALSLLTPNATVFVFVSMVVSWPSIPSQSDNYKESRM